MLVLQEQSFFIGPGTYYKAADCLVKTRAGQMILVKKGEVCTNDMLQKHYDNGAQHFLFESGRHNRC